MFIFIGAAALEYHVAKFHPSKEAIWIFLNNLRPPLNTFYNGTYYNFLTSSKKISSIEYLQKASLYRSLGLFALATITPVVAISVFWRGVSESDNAQQLLTYVFWLVVEILTLLRVYRFGHKLISIEKNLVQTKSAEELSNG